MSYFNPYNSQLKKRVSRQKAFFASKKPGEILVIPNPWKALPIFATYITDILSKNEIGNVLKNDEIEKLTAKFVGLFRGAYTQFYESQSDAVPAIIFYPHIGAITAAMTGGQAHFSGGTAWYEANLEWEDIARLKFDPESLWMQLALRVNRVLWDMLEDDYYILPFLHRSPLDAANGIRGTELFADMYAHPEEVKSLINWCADWSINVERFLAENVNMRNDYGRGVWDTWLPDGGIFVNGDPVGMISREMLLEFDRPYTEKLFTSVGGGFFHHHSIGIHQVDLIAQTNGLILQQVHYDPSSPHPADSILSDENIRTRFVKASLKAPIRLEEIPFDKLPLLLPAISEGRFILTIKCENLYQEQSAYEMVRKVSRI